MNYLVYKQYNLHSYDILVLNRLKLVFWKESLELIFFISLHNVFHNLAPW